MAESIASLLLMAILLQSSLVESTTAQQGDSHCANKDIKDGTTCSSAPYCGLYLAESSIPGAGVGIFTTDPKAPGDVVGDGDICIPVVDMDLHNYKEDLSNPFYNYFWLGRVMGMSREVDTDDIEAFCPGLDCAINCNIALVNVAKTIPHYNDGGLHRSVDPGVGSFSPYGNGTSYVTRSIPAGGELFKQYGDHWFTVRDHKFGLLPLSDDFPKASDLLKKMSRMIAQNDELFEDFYEDIILATVNRGYWESRTLNALPLKASAAKAAGEAGDVSIAYQPNAIRNLDWLANNGKCIDHIRSGPSTIRQAGQGAFAKRDLPSGTVITASPLIHLPDYTMLHMYNFTQQRDENGTVMEESWYRLVDEVRQFQLLYNYCFGHSESTMVLCPYGAGVNYINHNQSLVNVKIKWAQDFDIVHSERIVREGTIEELLQSAKPTLAFDYIAARDIVEGEELFLDYGDEWEEAWQKHIRMYEPYVDPKLNIEPRRYASSSEWNRMLGNVPLRTEEEQLYDPYPSNLQMRCSRKLLKTRLSPNTEYDWLPTEYGLPCRVLDRFVETEVLQHEEILYTVQIEHSVNENNSDEENDEKILPLVPGSVTWIERTDVPRAAVKFFDLPYTTNVHLVNSFRQEIGIPDEMMPKQWKNF